MKFRALKFTRRALTGAAIALAIWCQTSIGAEAQWPEAAPALGVLQTRPVFSLAAARHFEGLIVQHEHLTGERIVIVVRPWSGERVESSAEDVAQALSERWRLDTTRRGAGVLLVLQEATPGKIQIGYRPGIGLAKPQVASSEDLERLRDQLDGAMNEISWDEIAQDSGLWLLQSLASPLLERPDLLTFPKRAEKSNRTESPPIASGNHQNTSPVVGFSVTLLMIAGMGALVEAIRRGVKPQVLIGAHRIIRFTILDRGRDLVGKLFRSSRNEEESTLRVESLGGSS